MAQMSSLSAFSPFVDTLVVPTRDGDLELELRGLSADAITFLAQQHGEILAIAFGAAVRGEIDETNVETYLLSMLNDAPALVAGVIAFGCGEPEAFAQAAALPVTSQIEAVDKIIRLTFKGEQSPKKVLDIVRGALGMTTSFLSKHSPNGSGA